MSSPKGEQTSKVINLLESIYPVSNVIKTAEDNYFQVDEINTELYLNEMRRSSENIVFQNLTIEKKLKKALDIEEQSGSLTERKITKKKLNINKSSSYKELNIHLKEL